jgi:hypothetical protein
VNSKSRIDPMPRRAAIRIFVSSILLAAAATQAFALPAEKPNADARTPQKPAPASAILGRDIGKLAPEVQRMREAILEAAASGEIEHLRVPIEMNELPPVFGEEPIKDPIAHFKAISGDGEGREILAILIELLTTGYAVQNPGADKEMVIWPYHAEIPLDGLTPSQEVELYRLITPAALKDMRKAKHYSYYRLGISRDGIWHFFQKDG